MKKNTIKETIVITLLLLGIIGIWHSVLFGDAYVYIPGLGCSYYDYSKCIVNAETIKKTGRGIDSILVMFETDSIPSDSVIKYYFLYENGNIINIRNNKNSNDSSFINYNIATYETELHGLTNSFSWSKKIPIQEAKKIYIVFDTTNTPKRVQVNAFPKID